MDHATITSIIIAFFGALIALLIVMLMSLIKQIFGDLKASIASLVTSLQDQKKSFERKLCEQKDEISGEIEKLDKRVHDAEKTANKAMNVLEAKGIA